MNRIITQVFCFVLAIILIIFGMNIVYYETYGESFCTIEKKYIQRIYTQEYYYNITNQEYINITNNQIAPDFKEFGGSNGVCLIDENNLKTCYLN